MYMYFNFLNLGLVILELSSREKMNASWVMTIQSFQVSISPKWQWANLPIKNPFEVSFLPSYEDNHL